LIFTFGVGFFCNYYEPAATWLADNYWLVIVGSLLSICSMCAFCCVPGLGRQVPYNYIVLSLITIGMSILIGYAGAATESESFAIAAGMTAAATLGLTFFA